MRKKSDRSKVRIQLYKDEAYLWRWRMKAGNGKITADSGEGYSRRDSALRAAYRLKSWLELSEIVVEKD